MSAGQGVPLCDIVGQFNALQGEIEAAVQRVLRSGQVIMGPEVAGLESEVARYCGAGFAIGCSSGSDALSLALHGLGIGAGDEVITPPFTFFATVGAICRAGARPVFADIDPETYNIDPRQIEDKITPRTRALMIVHLFGQCADMQPLWHIAEKHGLPIIEDAAQAIGAEYEGKRTGTLGAAACFSFYPSKNLGAYGDAGMVVTNDPDWAALIARLRVHGMEPKYHHQNLGWNARIDAIHAAMLRVKLPHLDRWTEARQQAARRYDALIESAGLAMYLQRPVVHKNRRHVFNQYVVRVGRNQRDLLMKHLHANKIGCEIYYPIPMHQQECFTSFGHREGDFPASEQAARCVLALPMFPEITEEQQARVIDCCASFLKQKKCAA